MLSGGAGATETLVEQRVVLTTETVDRLLGLDSKGIRYVWKFSLVNEFVNKYPDADSWHTSGFSAVT
jgi:hypothetical protein